MNFVFENPDNGHVVEYEAMDLADAYHFLHIDEPDADDYICINSLDS